MLGTRVPARGSIPYTANRCAATPIMAMPARTVPVPMTFNVSPRAGASCSTFMAIVTAVIASGSMMPIEKRMAIRLAQQPTLSTDSRKPVLHAANVSKRPAMPNVPNVPNVSTVSNSPNAQPENRCGRNVRQQPRRCAFQSVNCTIPHVDVTMPESTGMERASNVDRSMPAVIVVPAANAIAPTSDQKRK